MAHINQCTFAVTGKNYQEQYWRTCYDCFHNASEGVCLNCGSENLIYQEGCLVCRDCGSSKCG